MYCADCESVDDYFFKDNTYFWIFVPTIETFVKVAGLLGTLNLNARQENSHCIVATVPFSQIKQLLTSMNGLLEGVELAGTKVTTMQSPDFPSLDAIARMATFEVLIHRYEAKWLIESIEQERYETWFQPIINAKSSLTSPEIFAYEGLFRVRDENDTIVPPHLAFLLAEKADLLFSLDLVARRSAVQHAAAARLPGKLFINFNPSSIYDPSYCLRSTAASIYEIGLKPSDIVFEVTETHKTNDFNHLKGILTFYRNAGFQVAIDDIGSGWSGLNLLQKLRPDYVKIDMDLVRDVHIDVFKQKIVGSLISIARSSDIKVIAEGVETIEEANWLSAEGADYLQGYYFGRPKFYACEMNAQDLKAVSDAMQPLKDAAKTKL